jgi:predicted amidohydrolase
VTRVAAVQFATGTSVEDNLATCLRMVDAAAAETVELVVLPEFCNHLSWYRDHDHAIAVAVDLDGPFVRALGDAAQRHRIWLKANVTTHRGDGRITATNILLSPAGELVGEADKLVLMGGERLHMSEADSLGELVETPFGVVGLYSCMDGVIPEPPRLLAVRGAQVLLNSLNSFALDEASLHIPVRAAENRCWVVAANKVGPLIPADEIEQVAAQLGVPAAMLVGAGESQIVAPDGTVVAIGPQHGEAVVVADIDVTLASDKRRSTGTDVLAARRPEIYGPLVDVTELPSGDGAAELAVACVGTVGDIARAVEQGARLVVLPELVGSVEAVRAVAGPATVVISVLEGDAHVALAVTADGVVLRQPTLHRSERHPDVTALGDEVAVVDLPWGRLALVAGEDVIYPEVFRLAVLAGAEVVACPTHLVEQWEVRTGLLERAAENRVNLVAASRPTDVGEHVVVPLDGDFTLWTQWETPFAGRINSPQLLTGAGVLHAVVRPACAPNKEISRQTDLVRGRPAALSAPLLGGALSRP